MAYSTSDKESIATTRNEELARQLMECAFMVMKNEVGSLFRKTLHDLMEYTCLLETQASTIGSKSNVIPPPPSLKSHSSTSSSESSNETHNVAPTFGNDDQHSKNHGGDRHLHKASGSIHPPLFPSNELRSSHRHMPPVTSRSGVSRPTTTTTTKMTRTTYTIRWKQMFFLPVSGALNHNPNQKLIVNGWIEQLRRSMLQQRWKEVLVSIVEEQNSTWDFVLWVHREIAHPDGRCTLKPLHQISLTSIISVAYIPSGYRITISDNGVLQSLSFRCDRNSDAACNWVLIIANLILESGNRVRERTSGLSTRRMGQPLSVDVLRSICHRARINTDGMNRAQLEMTVQRLSQNPAPVSLPATGRLSTHESIRLNPPNDAKSPWREQPTSPTDVHNGKNSNTTDPRVFVSSHPVHSEMQQVRESRSETLLAPNIQFEKRNEHGIRTMAESEPAGLPGGGVHPVANLKSVDGSLPAKPPPAKKPMPSPDDFCYSWGQPRQSSPYASYPFGNGEADPERNQTTTNEGDVPTAKRIIYGVLTEWALEPPALQSLRPIEYLLSSIHTVFPPRFGIPPHAHFLQWTPILEPSELTVASVVGSQPNDVVIGKVLRKLRFLLHSDKLPQDFSEEQRLLCKLLWDIVNDALEQYKGRSEEMG